jgi:hypothetical protein
MPVLTDHQVNAVHHYAPLHYLIFVARSQSILSKPSLYKAGFTTSHLRSMSHGLDEARGFGGYSHLTIDPKPRILRAKLAAGFPHIAINVPASENPDNDRWLLDSVRKRRQVDHFRDRFGKLVFHVHLVAPEPIIKARYNDRLLAGDEAGNIPYATAISHANEISSRSLFDVADFLVDLTSTSSETAALAIIKKWSEGEVNASSRFD